MSLKRREKGELGARRPLDLYDYAVSSPERRQRMLDEFRLKKNEILRLVHATTAEGAGVKW